jgi:hypothetical protein
MLGDRNITSRAKSKAAEKFLPFLIWPIAGFVSLQLEMLFLVPLTCQLP